MDTSPDQKKYDVFFSHAFEDKKPIADEIVKKLEEKGLTVFYSGNEFEIGDSVAGVIQEALLQSRFGIVLISPTYFTKSWATRECNNMIALESKDKLKILPVRYNITHDEVMDLNPNLADTYSLSSQKGIEELVDRLVGVIKGEPFGSSLPPSIPPKTSNGSIIFPILNILGTLFPMFLLVGFLLYLGKINTKAEVRAEITAHTIQFELEEPSVILRAIPVSALRLSHSPVSVTSDIFPESAYSSLTLENPTGFELKELRLPAKTTVYLQQNEDYLYLRTKLPASDSAEKTDFITGIISSGDAIQARLLPVYSGVNQPEEQTLTLTRDQLKDNLGFQASENLELVLYIQKTRMEGVEILEPVKAGNLSFVEIDQTRINNQEISTIESAHVHISGKTLLERSFSLRDEQLPVGTFLDFQDEDVYSITQSTFRSNAVEYKIYHPSARELRAGVIPSNMTSFFPTILDLIMAEPAKKSIYAILAFVVTQFFVVKAYFFSRQKKHKKENSQTTMEKIESQQEAV